MPVTISPGRKGPPPPVAPCDRDVLLPHEGRPPAGPPVRRARGHSPPPRPQTPRHKRSPEVVRWTYAASFVMHYSSVWYWVVVCFFCAKFHVASWVFLFPYLIPYILFHINPALPALSPRAPRDRIIDHTREDVAAVLREVPPPLPLPREGTPPPGAGQGGGGLGGDKHMPMYDSGGPLSLILSQNPD